ncbi:MAG: hypothetical protein MHM6MM_005572, partial [Cercozoa sp. M6MM]
MPKQGGQNRQNTFVTPVAWGFTLRQQSSAMRSAPKEFPTKATGSFSVGICKPRKPRRTLSRHVSIDSTHSKDAVIQQRLAGTTNQRLSVKLDTRTSPAATGSPKTSAKSNCVVSTINTVRVTAPVDSTGYAVSESATNRVLGERRSYSVTGTRECRSKLFVPGPQQKKPIQYDQRRTDASLLNRILRRCFSNFLVAPPFRSASDQTEESPPKPAELEGGPIERA